MDQLGQVESEKSPCFFRRPVASGLPAVVDPLHLSTGHRGVAWLQGFLGPRYLVAHPTNRKWVITPVINGIFVGLIHL